MLFFAGFGLSLLGSLPPGLISLAVAYTAIQQGLRAALWVALGATLVEFGQAWLAGTAVVWFLANPGAERSFQWVALPIFTGAALYLLFWARPPRPKAIPATPASAWHQLAQGGLISLFNLLALPYWFSYCGWLRLMGWWVAGWWAAVIFSTGVCFGTLVALGFYAWAGQKAVQNSPKIGRIANRVIGGIFLLLAGKLAWELVTG
ncbi:MAG: LysE family transporter [Saprospiraceae bacterium]